MAEVLEQTQHYTEEEGMRVENAAADINDLNSTSSSEIPIIKMNTEMEGTNRRFGFDTVEVYSIPEMDTVRNSSVSFAYKFARFKYFDKKKITNVDNIEIEVHFKDLSEKEYEKVKENIFNSATKFKEQFGINTFQSKEVLRIYLFNNSTDYSTLGKSESFKTTFELEIDSDSSGVAYTKPCDAIHCKRLCSIFTAKKDIDTLNHEMTHALAYYASGYKLSSIPVLLKEGLADYIEHIIYTERTSSHKHEDYYIKYTYDVMVDKAKSKAEFDEISELLNASRQIFGVSRQINLAYLGGRSLVRYLQEEDPSAIKTFLSDLSKENGYENAEFVKEFIQLLHNKHDQDFKKWLECTYEATERYMHNPSNFDAVLQYGRSIQNIKKRLSVYKALIHEVKDSGHLDDAKSKKLIQDLNSEILKQKNASNDIKSSAESLVRKLITNYNGSILDAANDGHLNVVKYFVEEEKVDVNTKDSEGKTPLHRASLNGHLNVVKYLLEDKHVDVDVKDNYNQTSLSTASYYGHLDVVKYLASKGADLNVKSISNWTPLHKAAWNSKLEVVKYLVEKGVDLNATSNNGWTPLKMAEDQGKYEIVKYLREKSFSKCNIFDAAINGNLDAIKYFVEDKKIDVNTKDSDGETPLHRAALNGHLNVIKYLVDGKHVDVDVKDNYNRTSLSTASYYGHLDVVKYLVEKGADMNVKSISNRTPLHKAAYNGKLDVVKYLVGKGVDLNAKSKNGLTPLKLAEDQGKSSIVDYLRGELFNNSNIFEAAKNGNLDAVKYFVEDKKVDVNTKDSDGETPLHRAALNGHLNVIKYLVDIERVDVDVKDNYNQTSLSTASYYGHLDVVKYLVEKGADLNDKDQYNWTPLHKAAYNGKLDVVKYLVQKGVDLNAKSKNGLTPLKLAEDQDKSSIVDYLKGKLFSNSNIFEAAIKGNLDAVKYFVEDKKVDVNTKDSKGKTPLHRAALNGHLSVIKYLVDGKHVDVDVKDNNTETALHDASYYGHLDVVKYLVEKGAELNDKGQYNWTPLHKAAYNDNLDVVKYLVEKGVDLNVKSEFGWTPLGLAENLARSSIVDYLKGKLFSNCNIFEAAIKGDLDAVIYFVEDKKVDVNTKDSKGNTPLHRAALNGHLNVIRYLVDGEHVAVDVKDNYNQTALHDASYYGHLDVVKYLVEKGADLNVKNQWNWTPLHKAAYTGELNVVKYLAEKGADLNVKSNSKCTPLHNAAYAGQLNVVIYLVEKEADLNVRCMNGRSPLKLAEDMDRSNVVNYLRTKRNRRSIEKDITETNQASSLLGSNAEGVTKSPALLTSMGHDSATVAALPEINSTVVNNALILSILAAANYANKKQHKQPIPRNLLSPRELSMRLNKVDEDMIKNAIKQGEEKFGHHAHVDEEEIGSKKTGK